MAPIFSPFHRLWPHRIVRRAVYDGLEKSLASSLCVNIVVFAARTLAMSPSFRPGNWSQFSSRINLHWTARPISIPVRHLTPPHAAICVYYLCQPDVLSGVCGVILGARVSAFGITF